MNRIKKIIIGVVILGLVGTIGVMACMMYKLQTEQTPQNDVVVSTPAPVSGSAIVVTEDDRNVAAAIQDKVKEGMICVKMTGDWVFTDGCKQSNAYLANSERNKYDLRFEVTLAETGEVLMVSPDVPVGACIQNFPLSVELEAGTYEIVVAHQQVKDGEIYNTVRTSGTITVE